MNQRKGRQIDPLPRPTSNLLRSSLLVPTYPSVLQELLHNSLDADASLIEIWINLTSGLEQVKVADDGCGIDPRDLGKIGVRHETSKSLNASGLGPVRSYGFRGEGTSAFLRLACVDSQL